MKLTKFVHACLLAEADGRSVLFDPGKYSWESSVLDLDQISRLDGIVITHEHSDHFYPPFVKALAERFPDVTVITTQSVADQLHHMGVRRIFTESNDPVQIFSRKPHAPNDPLNSPAPENIAVHFADKLTVGGDRQDLEETKEILALTIIAPWGSERAAAQMLLRLQPKYVIPIHDWHWSDAARAQEYDRFEKICKEHGLTFIKPADGESIEV